MKFIKTLITGCMLSVAIAPAANAQKRLPMLRQNLDSGYLEMRVSNVQRDGLGGLRVSVAESWSYVAGSQHNVGWLNHQVERFNCRNMTGIYRSVTGTSNGQPINQYGKAPLKFVPGNRYYPIMRAACDYWMN